MAYRRHKNFFRKSKLNLKTPLAYRCHKNFFRKSKLNLKTPLAYRCHRPICIAVGKEDILLQQSGSTINSHVYKMEEFSRRDEMKQKKSNASDKQPFLLYILFSMLISFSPNCTNSRGSTLLYFCALPETSELWRCTTVSSIFPSFNHFSSSFFASFRLVSRILPF